MARQILKLEFIGNRRRRLAIYRKRKETLKKAAYELSTLCGIPIAVIFFSPDGRPETWPEDEGAVRDIIGRHPSLGVEKRSKRPFDLQVHFAAQVRKTMCGRDLDLPPLDDMTESSLREMLISVVSFMEAVKKRIQTFKEDSRCNQGDTGSEQPQGFQCNNLAFMEECFDMPMVSKAAMDEGPDQGHGAFMPIELNQLKGVATNAYPPCSSTASMDFNYAQNSPASSMPLLFMPPPELDKAFWM